MPIFSSTIENLAANTMPQPYYRFDGTNDHIQITGSANLTFDKDFSLECRFQTHRDSEGTLVSRYNGGGGANRAYSFNVTSKKLGLRRSNDGAGAEAETADGNISLGFDDDVHGVAVYTYRDSTVTFYVNGKLDSAEVYGTETGASWLGGSATVRIGESDDGSWDFFGHIYEVRLWNFDLSAAEVKEMYSGASVPYKYKGANQTNLFDADAAAGTVVDQWAVDGNNTIAVASDAIAITYVDDGSGARLILKDAADLSTDLTIGKRYRFSCIAGYAGGSAGVSITIHDGNDVQSTSVLTTTLSTNHQIEFTAYSTDAAYIKLSDLASSNVVTIDNMSLVPVGAVAEYDGSGIASDKWFDKSGNDLHGTVVGATVENAPSGDDGLVYEEGTWTPTLKDPSDVEPTYFTHDGTYTRVGRLVTIQGRFYINTTTGMGGIIEIEDLPYTSVNQTAVCFGELRQTDRGGSTNLTFLASIVADTTTISMVINNGDGKNNSNALNVTAIGYATQWFFTSTYEI